jgi:REP element-mobilizing transposase RayT
MTGPTSLQYDTFYHIYNRGVNRTDVFLEERNYALFWKLYLEHIDPVARTYAYCLMKNHFHLLVRTRSEDEIGQKYPPHISRNLIYGDISRSLSPSKKFSDFFNAYSKSINATYQRAGSLFQHPFGRVLIKDDSQFTTVIAYIHQNPQKHHFVDDFRGWKYSSYSTILSENPTHLQRDEVLMWFGGRYKFQQIHAEWVEEKRSAWFAQADQG